MGGDNYFRMRLSTLAAAVCSGFEARFIKRKFWLPEWCNGPLSGIYDLGVSAETAWHLTQRQVVAVGRLPSHVRREAAARLVPLPMLV